MSGNSEINFNDPATLLFIELIKQYSCGEHDNLKRIMITYVEASNNSNHTITAYEYMKHFHFKGIQKDIIYIK